MPAKGKSRITDAQRRKIAAGKLNGKTHKAIAKETGLATKTIGNQSNAPRTLSMIQELKGKHDPQLTRVFQKGLDAVEHLLDMKGQLEPGVRLRAAQTAFDLVEAGEAPLKAVVARKEGDFTYEELASVHLVWERREARQ